MVASATPLKSYLFRTICTRNSGNELYVLISTFLMAGYLFNSYLYYGAVVFFSLMYLVILLLQKRLKQHSTPNTYHLYIDALAIICLALGIGLLQLNIIPIVCFMVFVLLIMLRHNIQNALILFLSTLLLVSIIWSVGFIAFSIRANTHRWIDYVCLTTTFLIFAGKYIELQQRVFQQQQGLKKHNSRIHQLIMVTNKLARYLPIQVWQPIISGKHKVKIHNHRAKLSILFADIAGFTELSDELTSDNLAEILNTYIEQMTIIAKKHNATLDKFIGDGMLCFFGDPVSSGEKEDALACVKMAIDMRREMRLLRQKWKLLGFKGLYVRIGVATGYSHVGNFGSPFRMNYTVIGREVNLASRLQAAAKPGQIFISDATYHYVRHHYPCKLAGSMRLKGFSDVIPAWQVLEPNEDSRSQWVEHDLPGFNLHLDLQDIQDYDKKTIKRVLQDAVNRIAQ